MWVLPIWVSFLRGCQRHISKRQFGSFVASPKTLPLALRIKLCLVWPPTMSAALCLHGAPASGPSRTVCANQREQLSFQISHALSQPQVFQKAVSLLTTLLFPLTQTSFGRPFRYDFLRKASLTPRAASGVPVLHILLAGERSPHSNQFLKIIDSHNWKVYRPNVKPG